ncbi:unnamed protein product [Schistocephalus solidus]|uniref:Na_H_Exchanger domain-containing protein n=1 Tax=Schistocephalus solidus TaxID=70667 RepID=A0A183TPY8_SCHSO|nr:unnamed protein product [Schistocephalus solidus]
MGAAAPVVGFGLLMTANKPKIAIPVSRVFVCNIILPISLADLRLLAGMESEPHGTEGRPLLNCWQGWRVSPMAQRDESRVRALGIAAPGLGYGWLIAAYKPEMAIPVSVVFVSNIILHISRATLRLQTEL